MSGFPQTGDFLVREIEYFLNSWHRIVIDHGTLEPEARALCRRRLLDVCWQASQGQPCQISLNAESIDVRIGPPDAERTAQAVYAAIERCNPGTWSIQMMPDHPDLP
jgi:hypothetical protein